MTYRYGLRRRGKASVATATASGPGQANTPRRSDRVDPLRRETAEPQGAERRPGRCFSPSRRDAGRVPGRRRARPSAGGGGTTRLSPSTRQRSELGCSAPPRASPCDRVQAPARWAGRWARPAFVPKDQSSAADCRHIAERLSRRIPAHFLQIGAFSLPRCEATFTAPRRSPVRVRTGPVDSGGRAGEPRLRRHGCCP